MLLLEYIEDHYGNKRGNKASFLRDNSGILPQELNRWINAKLKVNLRTGEIYKPTSKQINNIKEEVASEINSLESDTIIKLKSCAQKVDMSCDEFMNYLLDDEITRNEILGDIDSSRKVDNEEINAPVKVISEIINNHFAELSHNSEMFEFQRVLEELVAELLEKKLVNVQVPKNLIAESERLNIPRKEYYWHGSIVADRVAMMLGAYKVYLWHELYATNSEVVFLGTPNNVVACYLICERLCKLFKQMKNSYKKEQGAWGSKKDIEDSAIQYVYNFAQGIIPLEVCIYDDDSQMRLIQYASDKYSYAMD